MNIDSDSGRPMLPQRDENVSPVGHDGGGPSGASEAEWRVIPSHDQYEASSDGRIRELATGREVGQRVDLRGYARVNLPRTWGRGRVPRYVHRLMALAFFGPQPSPEHTDVAHWDGNEGNNTLANLRWATPDENAQDKTRHRGIA